jgi:general secretion pathway protein I
VSRRGFTLLEVMVALAILATALMAMADLGGSALENHLYARQLSAATLLARGKLAELEEKYDDAGFNDFDEREEGTFEGQGHPEIRWRAEVLKPAGDLGADQLVGLMTGLGGESGGSQGLLDQLLGAKKPSESGGPTQGASPAGAAMAGMIQSQLQTFGEQLKKSLRELRFTVAWKDGKKDRQFTVTTHLVVLNPRAPGGARGDSPDVPPGVGATRTGAGAGTGQSGTGTGTTGFPIPGQLKVGG